jgi:hypothetical protein
MTTITCDYCNRPAVWRAAADSPKSTYLTSRYVCTVEQHLIRAREVLGPCSVLEINGREP